MQADIRQSAQITAASLTPLDQEARAYLPTAEAAAHLHRRPQTLRQWAMHETGLVRPRRIGVRLMWPVADIRRALELA